jgi:hypothetical protein
VQQSNSNWGRSSINWQDYNDIDMAIIMRNIRKVQYLRILKRRVSKRMGRRRIGKTVSQFILDDDSNLQLFPILGLRRPLKLIPPILPSFEWPDTVKVVVSASKNTEKSGSIAVIPYEEDQDAALLTEMPALEFLQYKGGLELSIAQMKLSNDQVEVPQFVR